MNRDIPKRGFTHGGKFHADDVFTTAFLKILNPKFKVQRGYEVPEDFQGIVYDIGRGEFDHHQAEKEYRDNGCPYAAFGLVWRAFGPAFAGEEEAAIFDEKFIQPLDEADNTGCDNMLSTIIEEFNPGWDSKESHDICFHKAVNVAKVILQNHFRSVDGMVRGQQIVRDAMAAGDGSILELDPYVPWKREVIGSTYQFVMYSSKSEGDHALVCDFPKEWWGAEPDALREMSGIATLHFCHANGFLASALNREDALAAAEYAIAHAG